MIYLLVLFVLTAFADETEKEPVPIVAPAPLAPGEATPRDAFRCEDANKTAYKIRLTKEQKALVLNKRGEIQLHPLSDTNVGLTVKQPDRTLIYNGWNAQGKDLLDRLDLSTEVVTSYGTAADGTHEVTVTVLVDNQEPPHLQCKPTGVAVKSKTNPPEKSAERILRPLKDSVVEKNNDGSFRPIAILGAETTLRRYLKSTTKPTAELKTLLRQFDTSTLQRISKRLTPNERMTWDTLLQK